MYICILSETSTLSGLVRFQFKKLNSFPKIILKKTNRRVIWFSGSIA